MGKRSDGFYGFRLTGSFARLNSVQWMQNSPFPASGAGFGSRAAAPAPPVSPPVRRTLGAAARTLEPPASGPTVVDPRAPGANAPRYATQPRGIEPASQ